MSFALLRHHVINRGLQRKGKRRVVAKHAKKPLHIAKQDTRQIPKWENVGILGLRRFE